MINKRLVLHLETSTILTKQQYGFLQNHFTLDTLGTLHSDITDAIKNKQHIILLALDIEKAYDMVWKKKCTLNFNQMENIREYAQLYV